MQRPRFHGNPLLTAARRVQRARSWRPAGVSHGCAVPRSGEGWKSRYAPRGGREGVTGREWLRAPRVQSCVFRKPSPSYRRSLIEVFIRCVPISRFLKCSCASEFAALHFWSALRGGEDSSVLKVGKTDGFNAYQCINAWSLFRDLTLKLLWVESSMFLS